MTKVSQNIRFGSATLAIATGMTAWAAPASAQPPGTQTESTVTTTAQSDAPIIVTGSRIRRDPLSQDAPIVFVDQ